MLVGDLHGKGLAGCGSVYILHLVADFIGVGMPAAVGRYNAVAVERAVAGVVAVEISAVGKEFAGGIGRLKLQSLVGKVPDKAALVARVLAYQVPIFLEITHGVAHSVGILALDKRPRRILKAVFLAGIHGGVHRAHNVGIALFFSTLVLHGAAAVVILYPVVAGHKVGAVARLVAQAPDDDAGVVEVAIDHPLVADQVGCLEVGALGQSGFFIAHSVRLYVALVHHIEAVLVAQVVPNRVVGVVAGAHRIDIHLFHCADVAQHLFFGHDVSSVFAEFVAVGAFDQDRLAVDQQLRVLYLHGAETEADGGTFCKAFGGVGRYFQLIKIRCLGAPEGGRLYLAGGYCHQTAWLCTALGNHFAGGIFYAVFQPLDALGGDGADDIFAVHTGGDVEIFQTLFGAGINIHAAGDAAKAPEVLVLKVSAVAPAEYLQRDGVAARFYKGGQIEAGLQLAVLAVAHFAAVDPHAHVAGGAAYAQAYLRADPVGGNVKCAPVLPHVVLFDGRVGRIVLVVTSPGVADIHIQRLAKAVQLPKARNRHRVPLRIVVADGLEAACADIRILVPFKTPDAVQGQGPLLVRNECRTHRQAVLFEHVRILPGLHFGLVCCCRKNCDGHRRQRDKKTLHLKVYFFKYTQFGAKRQPSPQRISVFAH